MPDSGSTPQLPRVLAVAGPTASGKTAAAVALALRIGGEVVSADSMLVYRGMDIGTAKPAPVERRGVPHHLIDVADPGDSFSVGAYVWFHFIRARESSRARPRHKENSCEGGRFTTCASFGTLRRT